MEFNNLINQIETNIFTHDVDLVAVQINDLMMDIMEKEIVSQNDVSIIQGFNRILQGSMQAVQNKDYLLLADILEFRLKPFLGY